jgi:hypothetical protein
MLNGLYKIAVLTLLVLAGSYGVWRYYDHTAGEREKKKLQEEVHLLEQVVQRLSSEKRVAEVLVTGETVVDGEPQTTLLFVESDRKGEALSPRQFTIKGKIAHIEAMVIRFDRGFVKQNDPLKGHSIALFTRIYGEKEKPEDGQPIDSPGQVPEIYRSADPDVVRYEQGLWQNFWKLLEDASYRQDKGVRVAQGEALWWPPEVGKLYTISIESDGGLILQSKPIPAVYREALKRVPG